MCRHPSTTEAEGYLGKAAPVAADPFSEPNSSAQGAGREVPTPWVPAPRASDFPRTQAPVKRSALGIPSRGEERIAECLKKAQAGRIKMLTCQAVLNRHDILSYV